MKLQIKFDKEKFTIEIDNSATVKDLKRLIAQMKNCKISQIELIYSSEVLKNSQNLESQITDKNKSIHLFINELVQKKKKKANQTKPSENNSPLPSQGSLPVGFTNSDSSNPVRDESFFQLAQYVSKPNIRQMLYDQDIQSGLQMIYHGIEVCHNSGNKNYDHLLENLKLMMPIEQYSPTPPPSSSPSASSLTGSLVHDSRSEKNNSEQNEQKKDTENKPDIDYMALYKDDLQRMEELGSPDKEINLKALIKFNGDFDEAVDWLIQTNVLKYE